MTAIPARRVAPGQHIAAGGVSGTVSTVTRVPGPSGARYRLVVDTGHGLEAITLQGQATVTVGSGDPQDPDSATDPPAIIAVDDPAAPAHPFDLLEGEHAAAPADPLEGSATDHEADRARAVIDSLAHTHGCVPVCKAGIARMAGRHPAWVSRLIAAGKLPAPTWLVGNTAAWCFHDIVLFLHDHGHDIVWLPDSRL